jgi:hypothetical protein
VEVLLVHDEVGLRRRDVVEIAHAAVGLLLRLVDAEEVELPLRAGDPDDLRLRPELLDVRELHLALVLDGEALVVENLRRDDRALKLPGLDRLAAHRVRAPAEVVVGDAARVLDHALVALGELDVLLAHLHVVVELEARAALHRHQGIGPRGLLAHVIPGQARPLDRVDVGDDAVRAQQEERLRGPLVQVLLDVARAPDRAVGHAVAAADVAPDRREREAVVLVRRRHLLNQVRLGHDRAAHLQRDRS